MQAEPTLAIALHTIGTDGGQDPAPAPDSARGLVQRIDEIGRWAARPVEALEGLVDAIAADPHRLAALPGPARFRLSGVAAGHVPARLLSALVADEALPDAVRIFVDRLRRAADDADALPRRTQLAAKHMLEVALRAPKCRADADLGAREVKAWADHARGKLGALPARSSAARAELTQRLQRLPTPRRTGPGTITAELPAVPRRR